MLTELVDEENLPVEFGGKCRCEKYGGCWKGAGPWLSLNHNLGKGEADEAVNGEVKLEGGEVGVLACTDVFLCTR
jgi:hypothetical protein